MSDIQLPIHEFSPFDTSATGDLVGLTDLELLKHRVEMLCLTVQGEVHHRPNWGGDLPTYLEGLDSPQARAELQAALRRQVRRLMGVADASVVVTSDYPYTRIEVNVKTVNFGDTLVEMLA